jgi:hypothetical protein
MYNLAYNDVQHSLTGRGTYPLVDEYTFTFAYFVMPCLNGHYMYICVCIYIYVYIYIHTHTCIHTHTYLLITYLLNYLLQVTYAAQFNRNTNNAE